MTFTVDKTRDGVQQVTTPPSEGSSGSRKAAGRGQTLPRNQLFVLIAGVLLVSVLVLEFVGGFFIQQRAQGQLRSEFAGTLATAASAFGQPGLSPLPDTAPQLGSAVAQVRIPKIGVTQIAVEGSASEFTRKGLAHVPGTVLPGQAGHSIIVGRRTSFGAPLVNLGNVVVGSDIVITTIEGNATYKVIANTTPANQLPANLLTVITSNPPVLSISQLSIQAELVGKPFPGTPRNNPVSTRPDHLTEVIVLAQLLFAAIMAIPFARRRFGSLITWAFFAPVISAIVVGLALVIDNYLPSTL